MNRLTQSILMLLIGGLMISLEVSGRYMRYVKAGAGPLLLAGGIALVAVGAACAVPAMRGWVRQARAAAGVHDGDDAEPVDGHGAPGDARVDGGSGGSGQIREDAHGHPHDHDGAGERSWAGWLLLLPVMAVLLAPPALGADAVARDTGSQALAGPPAAGSAENADPALDFGPLPTGKDPRVPLKELVQRALYAPDTVAGIPVTVTGFIAAPAYGYDGGYSVAQLIISCCAADARAMRIQVDGPRPFPEDTWVDVVLTVRPETGTLANGYVPEAVALSIARIEAPADPYGR